MEKEQETDFKIAKTEEVESACNSANNLKKNIKRLKLFCNNRKRDYLHILQKKLFIIYIN